MPPKKDNSKPKPKKEKQITNIKDLLPNDLEMYKVSPIRSYYANQLPNASVSVVKKVVQLGKERIKRDLDFDPCKGVNKMKKQELINLAKKLANIRVNRV